MTATDSLALRLMSPADIAAGLRLSEQAGWNQTATDWRRFLALAPDGCFVAECAGQVCGTVTTCCFDSVGWVGMLLVDQDLRGRGVGTSLLKHAIAQLTEIGARSIRLDATAAGQPIYERYGFRPQFQLTRMRRDAVAMFSADDMTTVDRTSLLPSNTERARLDDLPKLLELDRQLTGYSRARLLYRLLVEPQNHAFVIRSAGRMLGFGLCRPGRLASFLGPIVAEQETMVRRLLYDLMHDASPSTNWLIDVPCNNTDLVTWLELAKFNSVRSFARMVRGEIVCEAASLSFTSSGPEKG